MGDGEPGQCLVAMARLQPFGSGDPEGGPPQEPSDTEFVARVSLDGRFSYLDHRCVCVCVCVCVSECICVNSVDLLCL